MAALVGGQSSLYRKASLKPGSDMGQMSTRTLATLSIAALKHQLGEALDTIAELLLDPLFPEDELDLLLARHIAHAKGRATASAAAAGMAIRPLIYGPQHKYGRLTGGNSQSLAMLTREMIVARHQAWLDPARATLVVVGDAALDQVAELTERAFGAWSSGKDRGTAGDSMWTPAPGRYLIERPGAAQTALDIAMASPAIKHGNEALTIFNSLFGGTFGSRLNANLRERKGWTYGVGSRLAIGPLLGSFRIRSEVQGDRTLDALSEIEAELRALSHDRVVTGEEIEEARHGLLVSLPSRWVSNGAVANAIIDQILFDLPDGYQNGIEDRIRGVTREDIEAIVDVIGDPERYSWVAAGDPVHARGADFVRIDAEGHRL